MRKTALVLMEVKTTSKQGTLSFELSNLFPELLSACPTEEELGYTNCVDCWVVPVLLSNPLLRTARHFFMIFPELVSV